MVADGEASPRTARGSGWVARLATPPGVLFYAMLVALLVAALWAFSYPGMHFLLWMLASSLLAAAGLVWSVRALAFVVVWRRRRSRPRGLAWLAGAPVLVVVAALLVHADMPLRARWALSRSSFEREAARARDGRTTLGSKRVGLYRVTAVDTFGDDVVFYERTGALSDDAGFAHLPDGPSADLESGSFEDPRFRPLGGGWYAWTASW